MNLPVRLTFALIASAAAAFAQAQQSPPLPEQPVKPADLAELPLVPPDIELFDRPAVPRVLPRVKAKQAADAMEPVLPKLDFGPQPSVFVKRFFFRGNSVFSDRRLARELAPFTGREITADELEAARVSVTKLYVDAGYINSGAVLPDQDPGDGTIEMDVVEGRIAEVDLSGNRWYRSWWLRHVMRRAAGTPANFNKLRTGLQLMRQNGSLSRINAELKPGAAPGEGILHVSVADEQPFRLGFEISNKRPISTGEGMGEFTFSDLNLTGHGDPLELRWNAFRWTTEGDFDDRGFDDVSGSYEFPVSPWGTTLRVLAGRNESSVIDETFAALGITSRTEELSFTLRQPLIETLRNTVVISLGADRRHSETFLLGRPFTLSPGSVDGEADVFAVRAAIEWLNRSQVHVFSFRSTFSWGLDEFGATRGGGASGGVSSFGATTGDVPDGKFFAWLGQAQYVRRIFDTPEWRKKPESPWVNSLRESLLVLRANAQISDEPLLSLEQYSLGGVNSVRGYRENQLLRDNGVFGSIEWRWPVWLRADKTPILTLAPFFDVGTAWNTVGDTGDDANETIASAGIGVLLNVNKHFQASIYWGHPFTDLITRRDGLQDHGWHVAFSLTAF
jgi:hemolysin activation/secretion protein